MMRRWFEAEVELKTEADGRVFPVTDDSQTVADALRNAAQRPVFGEGDAATLMWRAPASPSKRATTPATRPR